MKLRTAPAALAAALLAYTSVAETPTPDTLHSRGEKCRTLYNSGKVGDAALCRVEIDGITKVLATVKSGAEIILARLSSTELEMVRAEGIPDIPPLSVPDPSLIIPKIYLDTVPEPEKPAPAKVAPQPVKDAPRDTCADIRTRALAVLNDLEKFTRNLESDDHWKEAHLAALPEWLKLKGELLQRIKKRRSEIKAFGCVSDRK